MPAPRRALLRAALLLPALPFAGRWSRSGRRTTGASTTTRASACAAGSGRTPGVRGRWVFDTVFPGVYPGRTPHFHVKVRRPEGRVPTTQLYLPDEPGNRRDRLFDARLQVRMKPLEGRPFGRFDFVI